MKEFFSEYGLVALEFIGGLIMILVFFKVFWGGDSLVAPLVDKWLTAWMG